jgi:hypothetical protein
VAVAKQLLVMLENRPGSLAELCTELAKGAVNIQAIQASEAKPIVSVRLLVSQRDAAKKVCERMGLKYKEESLLTVLLEKSAKCALILCGVSDVEAASRIIR